jgi:hypothetical protein
MTDASGAIKAAAAWWRKSLERPKFDNGDESAAGGMATMLAMMAHKPPTTEQMDAFEVALAKRLAADLAERGRWTLQVDYDPDPTLYEAAKEAELASLGNKGCGFPWKTWMMITPEKVEVAAGYGAKMKTIFEAASAPALVAESA